MIAEAEKAAKLLEVVATKSPIAQSSLLETRKLIAEAIQSLESIDTQGMTESNVPWVSMENGSAFEVLDQVNGHTTALSSSDYKFSEDFGEYPLEKPVNGCATLPFSLMSQINECNLSSQQKEAEQDSCSEDSSPTEDDDDDETLSIVVTRKWVRGRLVEVAEENNK